MLLVVFDGLACSTAMTTWRDEAMGSDKQLSFATKGKFDFRGVHVTTGCRNINVPRYLLLLPLQPQVNILGATFLLDF